MKNKIRTFLPDGQEVKLVCLGVRNSYVVVNKAEKGVMV